MKHSKKKLRLADKQANYDKHLATKLPVGSYTRPGSVGKC